MDPLVWAVVCCFAMVIAVVVEMLTPSFGVLTVLAVGLSFASIYFGFQSSQPAGFWMVAANIALLPTAFVLAMHFMKHSPLLHRKDIQASVPAAESIPNSAAPPAPELATLIGQEGQAITPLRPAGKAAFGDYRVDVVTEGKFVDSGATVKVLRLRGGIVVVEPVA